MASRLVVQTSEGSVRGRAEGAVRRWRSIPFAAPPVGKRRWRAPAPVTPWNGVRDATEFANASCQPRWGAGLSPGTLQPVSEDCLTLNVVAPAEPSDTPRPVLVFIHGGGYIVGTSALSLYSGVHLVERGDVVFVSMNYRLGPLGYLDLSSLATPERPIDSNLGLRDQVAALEWVQRNIAAFGGDPDNVTIFGESAGGNAVTSLMVTPSAHGLFHRAIAQSAPAHWAHDPEESERWARTYVDLLGGTPDSAARAIDTATPKELGKAMLALYRTVAKDVPGHFPLEPTIDGDFFPEWPAAAFRNGTANRVPLIIGANRRESSLFAWMPDALPTKPNRIEAMFEATDPKVRDRVIAAYPGYPGKAAARAIGSDVTFWHPSVEIAEAHSEYAPTFMYRYDFAPRLLGGIGLGATHAMEMIPVFGMGETGIGRTTTALGGRRGMRRVTHAMQDNWLAFGRRGRPLASWPGYNTGDRATMIFDAPPWVAFDPHAERRKAWAGYESHHRRGGTAPGEPAIRA
ncbi:carboxylesterase/lipase family protein [Aldersonia sp. NBC_00410]|uniref:carboxylesterase/lipase family protein n=1 Tax=Aldersonia sp. NBC_00410 TaxID=2975954 RepID=UPI002250C462|nr:carboxylesterase/lipase family protein [Aldersonia sp. NBC_00410]MCX5041896.1 carboxylesterase/lipase family protein [Aldersonia sp. NBC_00410]